MSSVCVVCTRARALITDRDRRHRHAVLCTLLLLRRLRTQHPSAPPSLRVAACARGFSITAVAACARGSSLALGRCCCLRSGSRLLNRRRRCLRSRLLPRRRWPVSLSLFTCLWLFRRSAELLLRPYHCCRWRFFSFFSFFSFLSYFSFLGIAFSPHIYYTYFILFYYV